MNEASWKSILASYSSKVSGWNPDWLSPLVNELRVRKKKEEEEKKGEKEGRNAGSKEGRKKERKENVAWSIFLQPCISCNSTTWKANLSPIFPFLDHPDIKTWSSHYRLPMKLNVSLFISWILNGILHWIFYANYHDLIVTGPEIWGIQIL